MSDSSPNHVSSRQLAAGLLFGMLFGFLLQKGGVGKYHILMGQLLLRDWTVVKIMVSAIVVGMIGVYVMKRLGLVELRIKNTILGANIAGGLIFGFGFGLSAYCPGTNLSALGQGNWDALAVAAGLLAGSYLFAECSGFLDRTVKRWGDKGKQTLPGRFGLGEPAAVAVTAALLVMLLVVLEALT